MDYVGVLIFKCPNWQASLYVLISSHYLSCDDADGGLCTPDEKIYSSQSITQHNGNSSSIDVDILIYLFNLWNRNNHLIVCDSQWHQMTYPQGNITSSLETDIAKQRLLCQSMTLYCCKCVNKMGIWCFYLHWSNVDQSYYMCDHLNPSMDWCNQCKEQQWDDQHNQEYIETWMVIYFNKHGLMPLSLYFWYQIQ